MIEPVAVSDEDFRRFMSTTYVEAARTIQSAASSPAAGTPPPKATSFAGEGRRQTRQVRGHGDRGPASVGHDPGASSWLMSSRRTRPRPAGSDERVGRRADHPHREPTRGSPSSRVRAISTSSRWRRTSPSASGLTGSLVGPAEAAKKRSSVRPRGRRLCAGSTLSGSAPPQDGRISVTMDAEADDFRVSTEPGKRARRSACGILDKSNTTLRLDKLISHLPTLAPGARDDQSALRDHLRDGPDRLGQDHHALFGPLRKSTSPA